MFLFRCLLLLMLSPDQICNPSGSLISSSNLSPGLGDGRTILAAVLMFVMVVYSWYVIFFFIQSTHTGILFLTTIEPAPTATSLKRLLIFVPVDSPKVDSCLRPLKLIPNCQNMLLTTASFLATDVK